MIDLYAAGTSNGMRARLALEECGLPYKLHPVNLDKGEHKSPRFLGMNPNGQIPVIVDPRGPGGRVVIAQSTAILIYCAEKSGKLLPTNPAKRWQVWQALMSASTDITPTLGALFAVIRSKEPHSPTAEIFDKRLRGYFQVWDNHLARHKFCAADEYTIADLSLYAGYRRATAVVPRSTGGLRHLLRWADDIHKRPGVQRALQF